MKKHIIIIFVAILLIGGCTYFPKKVKTPIIQQPKSVIGGKGVLVEFLAGNPPLNEIDGTFNIILNFMNYGINDVNARYTIGSTTTYTGFSNLNNEGVLVEKAEFDEADKSKFIGPGKIASYQGGGRLIRNDLASYGPFEFRNFEEGATTQFYVDMNIDEYSSSAIFQFCVVDTLSQFNLGCNLVESLKLMSASDPVMVSSVAKTLSLRENDIRITLDITIEDKSPKQGTKQGEAIVSGEVKKEDNMKKVRFRIEPTGEGPNFECESKDQISSGRASDIELSISDIANVRCYGITTIGDNEKKNLQYRIDLSYGYRQVVSTPAITLVGRQNIRRFSDLG